MKRVEVVIQKREGTGKGAARSARRDGRVPGIVYGGGKDPIPVTVDRKTMEKTLHAHGLNENILVNLVFDGETTDGELGLIRDTQHDALSGQLKHLDFQRVSVDKKIKTTVPIFLSGNPAGVRDGGIMEQLLREVDIECFPLDIPDKLDVDVSGLQLGKTLHIYDVPQTEQYTILTSQDRAVVLVELPKAGVAEVTAAAVADAETKTAEKSDK